MKKLLVLTLALVMTLSIGYVTLASTIGIGATEGFQVELFKQIDPSVDPMTITGYYGLNEKLQLSLGYTTETEVTSLGARYAFKENMAVTFDYATSDLVDGMELGLRYKSELNDQFALVGVLSYADLSSDFAILEGSAVGLLGQAEYKFSEKAVGNIGFVYSSPDEGDATTDIIAGIEFYPIEKVCVYLDYTMKDAEGEDDTLELGASYLF